MALPADINSRQHQSFLEVGSVVVQRIGLFNSSGTQIDSFGGGTQYTEGDTDASITGTAAMMEVAADTLQPVQGTVADGLLVNLGTNNDVTVTGTVDLGATDNAVLDAIAASVASAATAANQLPDGHNVTVDNASIAVTGTFWQATQPVSGTVTANLSATDNAVLDNIQTAVELIDNAISGSEMQVDVVASLPAGTNAIGKLAANSGVDIGDVDVTSQPARDRTTDNQGVALQTDAIMNDTTALTPKFKVINATTNGDNTIVAAVAAKKIRVLSYSLVADAAVGVAFEDGAGGTELSGQMAFAANGGISVPFSPVGHFETTANTLLNIETDAVANVRGHLCYVEV